MAIPHNIEKDNIVKAIDEISQKEIPPYRTSYSYDLIYNSQKFPPKYIISMANKYANNIELDPHEFNAVEAVNYLRKKGFEIEKRENDIAFKNIMLYEVKKSASENYEILFDKSKEYFYWNEDKFKNLNMYDPVFVINVQRQTSLFAYLDGKNIKVQYDKDNDITKFVDRRESYQVKGKWNNFIRLKINAKSDFKDQSWKSLGNSELTYFYGKRVGKSTIPNNINRIEMLQKIFTHSEEATNVLSFSLEYLEKLMDDEPQFEKKTTVMDIKKIIEHVHKYVQSQGFRYSFEEIANFYLSLRAKPFVILAGISGTGKTQLPRLFAEALGFKKQVIQIPVRPDWTDSSDLLGYTSLDGNFVSKDLTKAIQRAVSNHAKPFFFILDEMNLARVEHYFSDFLSVIETRKRIGNNIKTDPILREEMIETISNKEKITSFGWPENLYLIGTVNMDETTHTFSRKVLDRANSIEMNEVNLNWMDKSGDKIKELDNIPNELFKTPYINSAELSEEEKNSISEEIKILQKVNKILQKADLHFAYRVRDEIAFYLLINKKYGLISNYKAFDFQLVQKILPRIHGSSERVQVVLVELLNILEGKSFRSESFEFSSLEGNIDTENLKYGKASSKIIFMLKRFNDDRFTSFWI